MLVNYKNCFAQERIDEDLVWLIENRFGPWVEKKGNSGYWDCVNIFCQYKGFLKRGLIRKDFAGLIVAIRPKGLKDGKTKEQLKNSMDQCPVSLKLNDIENYKEDDERGIIIKELDTLYNTPIPQNKKEVSKNTIKTRLKEYLDKRVATDKYTKICSGETYCGYTTTLSIEKYASENFINKKMPSFVLIIECIEDKISDDTITLMAGRYGLDSRIKIAIASPSGFDERVKKQAIDRNIQLIRVNPQYEITDNDILTPRMEYGISMNGYELKMLSGQVPMTVPLVIKDGYYTTTSITAFLKRYDIPVNNPGSIHAPMLRRDFIEEIVSEIIKNDVEKYVAKLKQCGVNDKVPYCIINPYEYAGKDRLMICRSDLSKYRHLGHIDTQRKRVWLSDKYEEGDPSDRFSMAHEYGHHILHSHSEFREFLKRYTELVAEAATDICEEKWLEVQANIFASYMLMPREIVELLYNLYWRKRFKSDEIKPLYVKAPVYKDKDFQNVVGPIARHMGVSLEAMRIRLQDLGLMLDIMERDMDKAI